MMFLRDADTDAAAALCGTTLTYLISRTVSSHDHVNMNVNAITVHHLVNVKVVGLLR